MNTYEELKARGLIAQVTDEERISDLINKGEAVFYIGFDPTADSLHVGHFMALCLMKRLQMAGNKPIALIGGGTAMIGDPSGKTDMRKMMTTKTAARARTGPTVWVIQRPRRPLIRVFLFFAPDLRRVMRPTCNQTPRLW